MRSSRSDRSVRAAILIRVVSSYNQHFTLHISYRNTEMTVTVPYDAMSTTSRSMLTKFFCCIPLRTGCFILGYLNLTINTFHTLALLILTTHLGVFTHGFDHFDDHPHVVVGLSPRVEQVEKPLLNLIGLTLMVILCANVAWLIMNIACLVGLHKRQPGPIRLYVGFGIARVFLSLTVFVYLVMKEASVNNRAFFAHCIDIGLTTYFIFLYYLYARQMEREREAVQDSKVLPGDIAFIYPTKIDKESLVA